MSTLLDSMMQQESLDERLFPWDSLILFRPSREDAQWLQETIPWGSFQYLDDGEGHLFTDNYSVKIKQLPKLRGKRLTHTKLVSHIRKNINRFIDTRNTKFTPFSAPSGSQRLRWLSEPPSRAVLHLDIFLKGLNIQDAAVMLTRSIPAAWQFTTVFTRATLNHPVCGNREFGIGGPSEDGSYTAFTRGVDRVCCPKEWFGNFFSNAVFKGQDNLWRSFQRKLAAFVNSNEGRASIVKPVNKKFFWREVVKWRDSFCRRSDNESEFDFERRGQQFVCGAPSIEGRFYQIKRGDSLFKVTSGAYGVSAGGERLRLAKQVNNHPFNRRFWQPPRNAFERQHFSNGIISFNPRFSSNTRKQLEAKSRSPRGSSFAKIFVPTAGR